MSNIFLSHSSADELEAVALKQWLLDNGWDDVFLDLDPERGLRAGERWQEALRRAADRCEAVVFVISPAWAKSKWCLTEFLLAKSLNKLIFGVVVKETELTELPTELTAEFQLTQLVGKGSAETIHFIHHEQPADISFLANGLGRLRFGLQTAGLSASFFPWPPEDDKSRAPYRGLEPLDAKDAAVFFGRDAEILQGLDRLRGMRTSGDEGLFVILGPSGAGKSSFLRAGLLPRLARNARHFHSLEIIRPERSPLYGERGLAHAISRANQYFRLMPANPGDVKTALDDSAGRLGQLLLNIQNAARHQLLGLPEDAPPPTLVLPVDQAEELFSADATDEARWFLDLIGRVLRDSLPGGGGLRLPLIIAFTIRSDRYEPLQTAPELMGLKTVVFDALKPMPRVQFKEVITGPAIRATLSAKQLGVKPDLVQQLLADSEQGGDTLPLLSLALSRLYRDYSSDGDLRLDEYQAMGGINNVIRTEIESILSPEPEIQKAELDTLRAAFIPWLATINPENNQPIRRVARMTDLPPASHALVQALIEKRLLLSDMRSGEQVVEVTHESLLRQWDILAKWLEKEGDDLKEADRLEQASAAWIRSGKKSDWLMEGERLAISEKLAAKPGYRRRLEPAAEFLLCSRQRETQRKEAEERQRQAELIAAQEKQAAAEEQQRITAQLAEAERKKSEVELVAAKDREAAAEAFAVASRRKTRIAIMGLGFAILFLAMAIAIAWWANGQRKDALAGELIATAENLVKDNPDQSLLLGLAAYRVSAIPRAVAYIRFSRANYSYRNVLRGHEREINSAQFSPHGKTVVTASSDNTARLWDAVTGRELQVLRGHEREVISAQFSLDGKTVVTASDDKTARLWDVTSGKELQVLRGHQGRVNSAQFSPDGKTLVTASADYTARLWDVPNGSQVQVLRGHEGEVGNPQFSPDGKTVVTASDDKTARLWDVTSGNELQVLRGHKNGVGSAKFSPDGKTVVTASADQTARLWDAVTGKELQGLRGHEDWVRVAQFSPDGKTVVTASEDRTARLWDAASGTELQVLRGHENGVYSAQLFPDGRTLVTASADKTVRLWNVVTGRELQVLRGHENWVRSAQLSPDGKMVVSASRDYTARLWDATTGREVRILRDHEREVNSAQFSPDGKTVVTASADQTARLWDAVTGKELQGLRGHEDWVRSAQFSPDGKTVVTASEDRTARLWDTASGGELQVLRGHERGVKSAQFSPDGKTVVTASGDKVAHLWDAASGRNLPGLRGPESGVYSAQFSLDGKRLVIASSGYTAAVWDIAGGKELKVLRGHEDEVNSAQFSPDGKTVVTASRDYTARLWHAASGRELQVLRGHEREVRTAQLSHDGRTVVTASGDNTARLWDAATARELQVLRGHEREVNSAQFSPHDRTVVTASNDNTVRLWRCEVCRPADEIAAELEKAVGRNLTEEERRRFGVKDDSFFSSLPFFWR